MYRYCPPKSSVWGHALRNMEPARQKELFAEFLKRAVAEYTFTDGSLTIFTGPAPPFLGEQGPWGHATAADVRRFEDLLGVGLKPYISLTSQQCDLALNEIIRNNAIVPGVLLLQSVDISKWLINGQPVPTESTINLNYGMKPCISTFLDFQTVEHFQFIKGIFSDLRFCTLNEKHLKPVK